MAPLESVDGRISAALERGWELGETAHRFDVVADARAEGPLEGQGGEARTRRHCGEPQCKTMVVVARPEKKNEEEKSLARCFEACLEEAKRRQHAVRRVAVLGTGACCGLDAETAARVAIVTVSDFLRRNKHWDVRVVFAVSSEAEATVYGSLLKPGFSFLTLSSLRMPTAGRGREWVVLVVDQNASNNWYKAFRGRQADGRAIRVEQTAWQNVLSCVGNCGGGVTMDVEPTPNAAFGTSMGQSRSFSPDICLVRNFAKGAKNDEYKNYLFALQHGGVPCVNSVSSLLAFTDRANAIAAGQRVERMIPEDFQMVPITFFSNVRELYFGDNLGASYPRGVVAKVGSCHSGYGKMRFLDATKLDDFHGVVSLSRDFVTLEPFLDNALFEYRLQRMGDVIRAYSRESLTHDWKANQGEGKVSDMVVTARHRRIAEAISKLYDGFDVWGADLMVCKDGQEYCLEINDSAIGFNENHMEEDMGALVRLVCSKLSNA